jgi:hypothetical protein
MVRNTGAAMGISFMTTVLMNHEQIHQSRLVEHFTVFDAWRLGQAPPMMPGAAPFESLPRMMAGPSQGLGMIYGMIQAQAAMLSFNDLYRVLAFVAILLVPSFMLLKRVQGPADSPAH